VLVELVVVVLVAGVVMVVVLVTATAEFEAYLASGQVHYPEIKENVVESQVVH
jgi:hypothetical protein